MCRNIWIALALVLIDSGCLPRTTVHKNPGSFDHGVRYYRPKPYLFITQAVDKSGNEREGFVHLETRILPDFTEEYSIHVSSGLGTNDTEITLTDGWNLTSLNVNIDSQFDENVGAVADLVSSAASAARSLSATGESQAVTVHATNVPLGLYEAVLSPGPDGRKRLYGFRYVGFFPYATCPLESCGVACTSCGDADLYGLVFEEGSMVFRPLPGLCEHHSIERKRGSDSASDDENEEAETDTALNPVTRSWTETDEPS